jgi:hypothetical protein
MPGEMKFLPLAFAALAAAGILAGTARADGLPVVGVDVGASGVAGANATGAVRYVALPARGDTMVARIEQVGGRVIEARLVPGRFTVPAVAYDGTADGLSADGKTLVLISPRVKFPRSRTTFAILDAERLKLREVISLQGDFSFDAISPSGSRMYLVQYLSPRDSTRYAVRAYDLRGGRLLPEPIVDPTEPDERMGGFPVTRAWSADGRWAYTLYDGATKAPFVHALDTSGRTARCIDLDELGGYADLYRLRLDVNAGRGTLTVRDGDEPLAVVDTRTFAVSEPSELASGQPARPPRSSTARGDSGFPWAFAAAPGLGLLLAAAAAVYALHRRPSPAAPRGT